MSIIARSIYDFGLAVIFIASCLILIQLARTGQRKIQVRRIPAIEALEEMVGRAAETGQSFYMATSYSGPQSWPAFASGLACLNKISEYAAGANVEVKAFTWATDAIPLLEENIRLGFLKGGHPELFDRTRMVEYLPGQDAGNYEVVDHLTRGKPGACAWVGAYGYEAAVFATVGSLAGAVQIGGTPTYRYIPVFAASCDYTLLGEELYAATAHIREDPVSMNTLAAQDIIRVIIIALMVITIILYNTSGATIL